MGMAGPHLGFLKSPNGAKSRPKWFLDNQGQTTAPSATIGKKEMKKCSSAKAVWTPAVNFK